MKKTLLAVRDAPPLHWVGDGFPVRSLFSYHDPAEALDPFLLLDHAGPAAFAPAETPRGVGPHPHRGFETVTIVYAGEVAHRDSTGQGGVIGPGDVQWMTAGAGILHEEFHSPAFTRTGGTLHMAQLWVNLPARAKSAPPAYQALSATTIPAVPLPDGAGMLRVIAGKHGDAKGPARTFTPLDVWDIRLKASRSAALTLPEGRSAALAVLGGGAQVNGAAARTRQLALLGRDGAQITLHAEDEEDALILLLSGEPLNEPVVGHGPFVMNTKAEIIQAVSDYNAGRFGRMSPDA